MAIVDIQKTAALLDPVSLGAIEKLQSQIATLKTYFKERDEIIEAMFVALLSKHHLLMIGPPGTTKSYLILSFAKGFLNYRVFDWQLTKFSTPEELFGPFSLLALKSGKYERITADKLPEAEFVYLDEVFNGNSSILNALNEAMNERRFERKTIPLESLFSGTNFVPEEPVLVAFFDRFLLRFFVDRIADVQLFQDMLCQGEYSLDPDLILDKAEITALQQKVDRVSYQKIVPLLAKIREDLQEASIYPSDRRFKFCIHALQAVALINRRDEVVDEDLFILKNMLWTDKNEIAPINQIVIRAISPALAQIQEYAAQSVEIERGIKTADPKDKDGLSQIMEAQAKLQQISEEINEMLRTRQIPDKIRTKAEEMVGLINAKRRDITKNKLKIII